MDIQTRKIEFIQSFLKLQHEDLIFQFEKLMEKSLRIESENMLNPFSVEELHERVSQSEKDFEDNKFKTSSELLAKY